MDTSTAPTLVVLITGASSGIGEATSRALAAAGHTVIAAARREDQLTRLADQVNATTTGCIEPARLDIVDRDAVKSLVDNVIGRHGRLDVIVNNAGVMPLSRLDALLVDEWDRMVDVNVRGLLNGIAATLPHFQRQGHGHLITVASVGAHAVTPTAAVYCGTKYAGWAITEGLRLELDPGIRVTTISPGVVNSELAESITDPTAQAAMKTYRANAIPASAIADAIAYAISQPANVDVNEIVIRPTAQR